MHLIFVRVLQGTDQGAIHAVLHSGQFGRCWEMLPCFSFVNGRIYFETPDKTSEDVIAVHMNWIMGSKVKVDCLRASGNWFLNGEFCDNAPN